MQGEWHMPKWFTPVAVICALMFVTAPIIIYAAPFESTMGLVQKIFYYHLPSAWLFLISAVMCGIASARYLFGGSERQDRLARAAAEMTVLFGLLALVTGPLWARKAWGVWWQWDARLTSSFVGWMVAVAYLLLRKYGGPGSEKLGAGLALFGMANVPFIYLSVNYWRTIHPATTVVPKLPVDFSVPLWFSFAAFLLLMILMLRLRIHLEEQRTRVDALYLSLGE
jgi:heme exporter protein C